MKKLLLSTILLLCIGLSWSQDSIPAVIISEWRGNGWNDAYIEITNVGDTAVDLSRFAYASIPGNNILTPVVDWFTVDYNKVGTSNHSTVLWGTLEPGQSVVLKTLFDEPDALGRTRNLQRFLDVNSIYSHKEEVSFGASFFPFKPNFEMWGFDSTSIALNYERLTRLQNGDSGSGLWYRFDNGDSLMIDQVRMAIDGSVNRIDVSETYNGVAGIDNATQTHLLIRKSTVKKGSLDWNQSRGVDISESEWIPVPVYQDREVYTTVGVHGDFPISLESETIGINMTEKVLNVPWGIYKYDSILHEFTIGEGMGWYYFENPNSVDDSAHHIAQTGDMFQIFSVGSELNLIEFDIVVSDPATDMAKVFPLRNWNATNNSWGATRYYVTEDSPIIDTIGNVPFATRTDTLFKYIEKAPNASWEIVWIDGEERADLKHGDKLRVTAEDGATFKEYFVDVHDYSGSSNVWLSAITWPDKNIFLEGWNLDTIPGFKPSTLNYVIRVPYETVQVPALSAVPENQNSKIHLKSASSLKGGESERTTTFTVTSESGENTLVYTVVFVLNRPASLDQAYRGEPFISEIVARQVLQNFHIEIVNPSDEILDLSNYLIVTTKSDLKNPAEALADIWPGANPDSLAWLDRYKKAYVPGYKFSGNVSEWQQAPLKLFYDIAVDPMLDPGDVFVISKAHHVEARLSPAILNGECDVILGGDKDDLAKWNPWGELVSQNGNLTFLLMNPTDAVFLFKITNPEVLAGNKELGDINDVELVDMWGSVNDPIYLDDGKLLDNSKGLRIMRSQHVIAGAPMPDYQLDTDWKLTLSFDEGWDMYRLCEDIGYHTMDIPKAHLSTVSSLIYLVDDGFEGELDIRGVSNEETVVQFLDNLIKADEGQTLQVFNIINGVLRLDDEKVAEGDSLVVTSTNGDNSTRYFLSMVQLDNNTTLTAVENAGIDIDASGETGLISGFEFGITITDLLDKIIVPGASILNITDTEGNIIPLKILLYTLDYTQRLASSDVHFEVIAENGDKKVYMLSPAAASSDAYIMSEKYEVVEEPEKAILNINRGIAVSTFMNNILPVPGATVKVISKTGQERSIGQIYIDDRLIVTSEDGTNTVSYELYFIGELYAYVTSEFFTVNQDQLKISVVENTTVEDLLGGLVPALNAVIVLRDKDGNEKTTGIVANTDVIQVTSGDGLLVVNYTIEIIVSSNNGLTEHLKLYPNPVRDLLFIKNIPVNSHVQIIDISGRVRKIANSREAGDGLYVGNMQPGMYLASIRHENRIISVVKFIIMK